MMTYRQYITGGALAAVMLLTACAPVASTEDTAGAADAAESEADVVDEAPVSDGATLESAVDATLDADSVPEDFIPVTLDRAVDGDTVHVMDADGETLKLRLLLIDTPETKHPDKPVEPFGEDAAKRLAGFLESHGQLYIEYDDGDAQDHYGRELVYLYATDSAGNVISAQEVLLEEGLARVGYIYEQQRHLDRFMEAEARAKIEGRGIWSIPGYVNPSDDGFNPDTPGVPSA